MAERRAGVGFKAATGFAANRERGLSTSSGFVMLFDAATGQPRAMLADDGYLTELRTGAAGALAASLLAIPHVRKIAMIGAGGQARFQLRAISEAIDWKNVHAELGAVLLQKCSGRESSTERIVCDLTGTGAQDAALAEAVWTAYQATHAHATREAR